MYAEALDEKPGVIREQTISRLLSFTGGYVNGVENNLAII